MNEDAVFFVGQKAFIEKDGEVLVLSRANGGWLDLPGGKIQEGETDLGESLIREVREETSLEIEIGEPFITRHSVFPEGHHNAGKKIFLVSYKCKYKSGEVTLSEEHSSYQWVNKESYKTLKNSSKNFVALEKYFCQKD
jgi:8-oxo-dGTP diphosphatase